MEGVVERLDPPVGPFKGAIVLCDDGGQAFLTRDEAKQSGLLNVQPGQRLAFTLQQNPKHVLQNVVKPQLIVSAPAVVAAQALPVMAVKFFVNCSLRPDQNGWFHLNINCEDASGLPAFGTIKMGSSRVFKIVPQNQATGQPPEVNNHILGVSGNASYFLAIPPGLSNIDFYLEGVNCSYQLQLYMMFERKK